MLIRKLVLTAAFAAVLSVSGAVRAGDAAATAPAVQAASAPAAAARPGAIAEYRQRLDLVRRQVPEITAAAEAVAERWFEHPDLLLHFPFGGDTSNFSMEFIARAGGLDNALPDTMRKELRTPHDVVVFGVRSWETGGAFVREQLVQAREAGWLTVVFGSRRGMPEDIEADILIDNGAGGGGQEEAAINQIVNMTNGWMWCCEVAAALTRRGLHPGVLLGMPVPGATEHNKKFQVQDKASGLYPLAATHAVAAGVLAEAYLAEVTKLLADLESPARQAQIAKAADLAADRVRSGRTLWAASFTHVLDGEVFLDNLSPIRAFRAISPGENGETFTENLKPGDLLLFFGEWTLNIPWRDYLKLIRSTGADFIVSYRPFDEEVEPYEEGHDVFYDQEVDDALMVLEQRWPFENAVVPIPFPPGRMAPVSGIYVCLLYRTLDEVIAERLAADR